MLFQASAVTISGTIQGSSMMAASRLRTAAWLLRISAMVMPVTNLDRERPEGELDRVLQRQQVVGVGEQALDSCCRPTLTVSPVRKLSVVVLIRMALMNGQKIRPAMSRTIGSTNGIGDLPVAAENALQAPR